MPDQAPAVLSDTCRRVNLMLQTPKRESRRRSTLELISPSGGYTPSAMLTPVAKEMPAWKVLAETPVCRTPTTKEPAFGSILDAVSPQPALSSQRGIFRGSPPSAPRQPSRLSADVDEAVSVGSLPQLALVLQGNQNNASHLIHEAIRRQSLPALDFLLRSGFRVYESCQGRRPIHLAEQHCLMEGDVGHRMLQLLLQYGAKANRIEGDDPMQESPLHSAAQRCCLAAVAVLLSFGADPNQADTRGDTPMHAACRMATNTSFPVGNLPVRTPQHSVIALLLQHGACPLSKDALGLPPLMFASKFDCRVRHMLAHAERWWNQSPLTLVNAQLKSSKSLSSANQNVCTTCLGQAGLAQHIASFL
jgi:ankyrin repeat protein